MAGNSRTAKTASVHTSFKKRSKKTVYVSRCNPHDGIVNKFPPDPTGKKLTCTIIENFCTEMSPDCFEESACAVCFHLTSKKDLASLEFDASILLPGSNMTRIE